MYVYIITMNVLLVLYNMIDIVKMLIDDHIPILELIDSAICLVSIILAIYAKYRNPNYFYLAFIILKVFMYYRFYKKRNVLALDDKQFQCILIFVYCPLITYNISWANHLASWRNTKFTLVKRFPYIYGFINLNISICLIIARLFDLSAPIRP